MRLLVISVLGLLIFAMSVSASPADEMPSWLQQAVAIKVPSYDKNVPAVVLADESQMTIGSDGKQNESYNYAVRILDREGRGYATGQVSYHLNISRVKEFRAWLIRPDGTVKRYGKDDTMDVAGDLNDVYNEYRVKRILGSDDADTGAVFAYTYTREARSVFSQAEWFFQTSLPVINSRYNLTVPEGWRAEGVTFNHPKIEPKINGTNYVWELSNLAPIPDEPLSPSLSNLVPRLAVSYFPSAATQSLSIKTFTSWGEVASWLTELSEPQVIIDDAMARKAHELTALAKTEFEKIRAIAKYVQSIQYISIQTGVGRGGGYRPHAANEVFAKSYGDCKDKANLMRAMLKVVGIDAYPVSIYSGDPNYVRASWPSPQQFNHCIIAVKVSDQTQASTIIQHPTLGRLLVFDATDEQTPLGDLPYYLQGSLALISSKTETDLVKMPVTPPEMNQLERTATLVLQPDGGIAGQIRELANGQTAVRFRAEFHRLSKSEYTGMIERWLTTGAASARLNKMEPTDHNADGRFSLNVEFSAPTYGQLMQGRLLVFKPAVVSRREGLALTAATRKHPLVLRANEYSETVRFQLPAGFIVDEVPDAVKIQTSFGSFVTSYQVENNQLIYKRQLSQQATTIAPADYEVVRKFFENIRAAENAPVVLARK
ncbi:MAG TPA: DUF3857 domain-containing protein [Pyrinomonadaceae bacterium]|nr:DUF3857 domain-containing protein [Pyrinomonadaceae bacterium]